jgi:hypothetical protein
MLEIVEYSNDPKYYFRNIPEQDNPTYGDTECLMIVPQEPQEPPYYNCGHWDVLHIVPVKNPLEEETVTQLGKFWELDDARLFAKAFAERAANSN